ncbi:hypothetical protein GGP41_002635 [Bipolaris sorokiniana]|uniref:Extracellular membrane protein CFEM domain-containing protein n=2 Tax=Cochliobolus sativus TaxID=45130 RepID=A0A8H6DXR1_COCSA|nr:uncharacterized protein COCSADRAFT_191966 [Bipolaris sorokiniana ND90Pr]EMD61864.1 hypothetical protein COCSADRAFT_191966 [Bipolaris sorokiniana ND90Pr]KAF5850410.1 hypothetical protein GGP41_002635 [Bipolaris sorokiniana]
MKAFFVALVALPAVLAAALPSSQAAAFPIQSQECTCQNAAGATRASGLCQYMRGALRGPGEWCFPGTSTTAAMNTIFNDERCLEQWGSEWSKGVCRPVLLCQGPGGPDYYEIC